MRRNNIWRFVSEKSFCDFGKEDCGYNWVNSVWSSAEVAVPKADALFSGRNHYTVRRVVLDEVDGVVNGAVVDSRNP